MSNRPGEGRRPQTYTHPSNDHRVPEPGKGMMPVPDLRVVGTEMSRAGF